MYAKNWHNQGYKRVKETRSSTQEEFWESRSWIRGTSQRKVFRRHVVSAARKQSSISRFRSSLFLLTQEKKKKRAEDRSDKSCGEESYRTDKFGLLRTWGSRNHYPKLSCAMIWRWNFYEYAQCLSSKWRKYVYSIMQQKLIGKYGLRNILLTSWKNKSCLSLWNLFFLKGEVNLDFAAVDGAWTQKRLNDMCWTVQ